MSGNTTMLGMSLGSGGSARSASIAVMIGSLTVGAAAGEILLKLAGQFEMAVVLFAVSVLLCIPMIDPSWTAFVLVLAMGTLNAAMSRLGTATVSVTYVTGALVKFGRFRELIGLGRLDGSIAANIEIEVSASILLYLVQGFRVVGKTGTTRAELMAAVDGAMRLFS